MTTGTTHRESARETAWNMFLTLLLTIGGFFMTFYSAAIITGLIARWLTRP